MIALTDHFSPPVDDLDIGHNILNLLLGADGRLAEIDMHLEPRRRLRATSEKEGNRAMLIVRDSHAT